jgi:hypothetical protein
MITRRFGVMFVDLPMFGSNVYSTRARLSNFLETVYLIDPSHFPGGTKQRSDAFVMANQYWTLGFVEEAD